MPPQSTESMIARKYEDEPSDILKIGTKFKSPHQGNNMTQIKKVILVEDNPADVELTKLAFRNQAFPPEITHFTDGKAFLDFLRKTPLSHICYILLDLNMPKISGIEVLKALSTHPVWHKLPVIVFTSSSNPKEVNACYEQGANAYVLKPFDFQEYDKTIKAIHEFWCGVNIAPAIN